VDRPHRESLSPNGKEAETYEKKKNNKGRKERKREAKNDAGKTDCTGRSLKTEDRKRKKKKNKGAMKKRGWSNFKQPPVSERG